MQLRGEGEWEGLLQVLLKSNVRALNERQLTEQEKEDIHRVRARGGGNVDNIEDERAVATVTEVGEGQCRPSWIWFSGHSLENMNDLLMRAGGHY